MIVNLKDLACRCTYGGQVFGNGFSFMIPHHSIERTSSILLFLSISPLLIPRNSKRQIPKTQSTSGLGSFPPPRCIHEVVTTNPINRKTSTFFVDDNKKFCMISHIVALARDDRVFRFREINPSNSVHARGTSYQK